VDLLSVRRTEGHLEAGPGLLLFRRAWLPRETERVLAIVHGFAEHSGRYDTLGAWFAARGCAVHSYDQRGHGRSDGPRRHIESFDEYLDDLDRFLERVAGEHPDLPLFLVGHSMGGLVAAAHACERSTRAAAIVLSGPALRLPDDFSPLRLRAVRLLRRLAPRVAMKSGIDPDGLSRDPEVVRNYLEDPLVDTRMTFSHAASLLEALQRTAATASRVRAPMLLLHGADDPICPVEGSRAFHAGLAVPGSALRIYPRLRHEIFNEPERETVYQDLLDWLRAREASA
jgi:alpha-beta hydrolase superfamily lysophospholipase